MAGFREPPGRSGFFERQQFDAILKLLPPDHADLAEFLYFSGWRHAEARELPWSEVDVDAGVILLSPERSKNETGRALPISGPIADVISRRLPYRGEHDLVFTRKIRATGARKPLGDWRKAWNRARIAAGAPNALLHDCRRTVVRNLIRAGVHERTAMSLPGTGQLGF